METAVNPLQGARPDALQADLHLRKTGPSQFGGQLGIDVFGIALGVKPHASVGIDVDDGVQDLLQARPFGKAGVEENDLFDAATGRAPNLREDAVQRERSQPGEFFVIVAVSAAMDTAPDVSSTTHPSDEGRGIL